MVTLYILVLCFSALLGVWAVVRLSRRIMPMLNKRPGTGAGIFFPSVMFLTVVIAPPAVLVGSLLAAGLVMWRSLRHLSPVALLVIAFAAVLVGMIGLRPATAGYLAALPPLVAMAGAGLLWFALTVAAPFGSVRGSVFSYGALASLAAIAASPLQVASTHPLTLDAAIIASAFIGALLAGGGRLETHAATRIGIGFLIAYLQVAALWQGAWITGLASIALWAGAIALAWMQQDTQGGAHA